MSESCGSATAGGSLPQCHSGTSVVRIRDPSVESTAVLRCVQNRCPPPVAALILPRARCVYRLPTWTHPHAQPEFSRDFKSQTCRHSRPENIFFCKMKLRFAANLSLLFGEASTSNLLPRYAAAKRFGFDAVECTLPYASGSPSDFARTLEETQLKQGFSLSCRSLLSCKLVHAVLSTPNKQY